jgi:hypothetical protein
MIQGGPFCLTDLDTNPHPASGSESGILMEKNTAEDF